MTTFRINLPDPLAEEAARAGLLDADKIEALLREQLRARRVERLRLRLLEAAPPVEARRGRDVVRVRELRQRAVPSVKVEAAHRERLVEALVLDTSHLASCEIKPGESYSAVDSCLQQLTIGTLCPQQICIHWIGVVCSVYFGFGSFC